MVRDDNGNKTQCLSSSYKKQHISKSNSKTGLAYCPLANLLCMVINVIYLPQTVKSRMLMDTFPTVINNMLLYCVYFVQRYRYLKNVL